MLLLMPGSPILGVEKFARRVSAPKQPLTERFFAVPKNGEFKSRIIAVRFEEIMYQNSNPARGKILQVRTLRCKREQPS